MNDVIVEDSKVCLRDCWRVELEERYPKIKSLQEYTNTSPCWEDIEAISIDMAYKYFAVNPAFFKECR